MLVDVDSDTIYVPVSRSIAKELAEWSEPVQIRLERDSLVARKLAQPVKGVYITDDDAREKPL